MTGDEKRELYRTAAAQIGELVSGLEDPVAAMASCSAVLHELLPASIVATQVLAHRGSVSVTARYVGDRDDLDFGTFPVSRVILPSYVRMDIGAEVHVWRSARGHPAVRLTGRLENVFDTQYREVYGFLTPGRTIAVGLRATL